VINAVLDKSFSIPRGSFSTKSPLFRTGCCLDANARTNRKYSDIARSKANTGGVLGACPRPQADVFKPYTFLQIGTQFPRKRGDVQVRLETSVLFQALTRTLTNINVVLGDKRVNFAAVSESHVNKGASIDAERGTCVIARRHLPSQSRGRFVPQSSSTD
jgi:hypothetical protein